MPELYRYRRIHLPTGKRTEGEREFNGPFAFAAQLAEWNRAAPRTWHYEPIGLVPVLQRRAA